MSQADVTPVAQDAGTRRAVLQLVARRGPVTAVDLATELGLTAAGVRRHLGHLEDHGQVAVHDGVPVGPSRRGRPAKRYVVTSEGQAELSSGYSELAADVLRYLDRVGGAEAVEAFAEVRTAELVQRLAPHVPQDAAPVDRVRALAGALSSGGFAATARPVPGGHAVQLCQGHCPVQAVAAEFPQLCEAEARGFARLLGVHVQRLSTLAGGGHVCTTNIPTAALVAVAPTSSGSPSATSPVRGTEGPHA